MEVSEARRLKALEKENAKLKRLLAESVMAVSTLKELLAKKLVTPGLRREAVTWAIREKEYSQRRAMPAHWHGPEDLAPCVTPPG